MNVIESPKLVPFPEAAGRFAALRHQGKRIVHCHGTFDLLHAGHLIHFEEAKSLGDLLVVSITAADHVNKGPGRPVFNDALRSKMLSALECVDYVVIVPHPTAVEVIAAVCPDIYCKGTEYAEAANDVTAKIAEEVAAVEAVGGRVAYVGSEVFSSTRLLNNHFSHAPTDVRSICRDIAGQWPPREFRRMVDELGKLRVLVVGDLIFDRYTTVRLQGLTSKSSVVSTRYESQKTHAGGALAVYRHLKGFTSNVRILGVMGLEPELRQVVDAHLEPAHDAILSTEGLTSVVKQRWVEPVTNGSELSQLFAVNYLSEQPREDLYEPQLLDRLRSEMREVDLVVVMDFGHGTMTPAAKDLVQEEAPFLFVNCQTNSNNYGFNAINRRYRKCDAFSVDERELKLACDDRYVDCEAGILRLHRELGAEYGWLTRGPIETLGVHGSDQLRFPALQGEVVDTLGAGDAFASLAALAAGSRLPLTLGTFLGQLAGVQAVQVVGNETAVRKDVLLKGGMNLLNF